MPICMFGEVREFSNVSVHDLAPVQLEAAAGEARYEAEGRHTETSLTVAKYHFDESSRA